mgnify:CR=1 FL=1
MTEGPYQETVCKAINWLLATREVDPDTYIGKAKNEDLSATCRFGSCDDIGRLYGHFLAQWGLAEALILGGRAAENECEYNPESCSVDYDEMFLAVQQGALFTEMSRNSLAGQGWDYRYGGTTWGLTPFRPGDLSHAKFAAAAQVTADKAGIPISSAFMQNIALTLANRELNMVSDPSAGSSVGTLYSYKADWEPSLAMSAAGLLCRRYVNCSSKKQNHGGIEKNHAATHDFLSGKEPEVTEDVYTLMHLALLNHFEGGGPWAAWYAVLAAELSGHQDTSGGHQDGSYFYNDNDGHNTLGGRFYWTTFVILSLTPERSGLRVLE